MEYVIGDINSTYISCGCNRTPHAADWGQNGLVCYGACNAVAIYDYKAGHGGRVVATLSGHQGRVNAVKWVRKSDDSWEHEFVSVSTDQCALIWTKNEGTFVVSGVLKGHEGPVTVVDAYNRSHRGTTSDLVIVTASGDSTIRVWERNCQQEVACSHVLPLDGGLCLSACLAVLPCGSVLLAAGLDDSNIHLYSETTPGGELSKQRTLRGHEDWVSALQFAREDFGDLLLASGSQDATIRLWRFHLVGEEVDQLTDQLITVEQQLISAGSTQLTVGLESVLLGHDGRVYGLCWHPSVPTEWGWSQPLELLSASLDKTVVVWAQDEWGGGVWLERARMGEVGGNTLGFYGACYGPAGASILAHSYTGGFHVWHKQQVIGENPPKGISSFESANLSPILLDNVRRSGYEIPTPVQSRGIPIILAGRDLMACATTGSGKTAAYLIPIIQKLLQDPTDLIFEGDTCEPQVIIVSATRESAIQIFDEARKLAKVSILKICTAYGGTGTQHRASKLGNGCHILVATPSRLNDFVGRGRVQFGSVRFFVLDEADRMLDMGFLEDMKKMLDHETMVPTGTRQTLMFSATFPKEIQQLASSYLHNYLTVGDIVGGACSDVEQVFYQVARDEKKNKLRELLMQDKCKTGYDKVLVFVETKRSADFIAEYLSEQQIPTTSIFGDRMTREREIALNDFKFNRMRVLVATAVAARSLDIKGVAHVINYDLPKYIGEYVHRIGRTGRVGRRGKATSFYDADQDSPLAPHLVKVLQEAGQEVPEWLGTGSYSGGSGGGFNNQFGEHDYRKGEWGPGVMVGGHYDAVNDIAWEPHLGRFIISVSTDQTTRLHAPWLPSADTATLDISWHEIARPQIHGYDLVCVATLPHFRFVSGADEKVVRAFTATQNFLENFKRLCLPQCVVNEEGIAEEVSLPTGAAVPVLGLSNKAVFQSEGDRQPEERHVKDQYDDNSFFTPQHLTEPPTEDNLQQNTLWPETMKLYGHGYEIFSIAATSDGKLIASACKATNEEHAAILLWDTTSWQKVGRLVSHQLTVTQLQFSPDDRYLLSVSRDRRWSVFQRTDSVPEKYQLVDRSDKTTGVHARIIWCCGWSHDSSHFATGSRDGKVVVWSCGDEKHPSLGPFTASPGYLDLPKESITSLAFAPGWFLSEGEYLMAVGAEAGDIRLYGWKVRPLPWRFLYQLSGNMGHQLGVKRLAFRPVKGRAGRTSNKTTDDTLQLASCSLDHTLKIYDVYIMCVNIMYTKYTE